MESKDFKITIKKENGQTSINVPENLPKELHIDDVFAVIQSKLKEEDSQSESIITQEEIHSRITEEFGSNKMALWGDHSHGTNSAGNHSHN